MTSWTLGDTLAVQEQYPEAMQVYLTGFSVDLQHHQAWVANYIQSFKAVVQAIGESQFFALWREVTGEEFAGQIRDLIMGED
jgi:hypothetical protein